MAFLKKTCKLLCSGIVLPLVFTENLITTQALQLRAAAALPEAIGTAVPVVPVVTPVPQLHRWKVIMPNGAIAGQKVQITFPNGLEQLVQVPQGVSSGGSFTVDIAPKWLPTTPLPWFTPSMRRKIKQQKQEYQRFYGNDADSFEKYEKHVLDWVRANSAAAVKAAAPSNVLSQEKVVQLLREKPAASARAETMRKEAAAQRAARREERRIERESRRSSSSSSSSTTKSCSCGGFEPFFYGMLGAVALVGGVIGAIVCSANVQTQR